MEIRIDNLSFCQDCTMAAVNDDYTGIDYYLATDEANKKMEEIKAGLIRWGNNLVLNVDSETGDGIDGFSNRACDCCGTRLAGERHRFAVLG